MSAVVEPSEAVITQAAAVRLRGVRRTFAAELAPVRALRGVDLDIADGEFLAVMGPSGCGKSTLLNIIAGLEKPSEGGVVLEGREIKGPGIDRMV
ncbi:MAG: putative transport system ATP-binding protein, partial [Pseudonocardiales bacterium]|nr:putative transport system ATP-binding protein [Pseudonocardiales bacterium]